MKNTKPACWLFLLCQLCCLFTANIARAAGDEGKPAPVFAATTLDGKAFQFGGASAINADNAANGDVVIVNFWATWCAPCRQEMPDLQTYYQQHKQDGLRLLAISMDAPEDEAKVRALMAQFDFPAALKNASNIRGFGRIWRMPMTFVIDRHGILRRDGSVGEPKIDLATLERLVTPLLAESKKSQ